MPGRAFPSAGAFVEVLEENAAFVPNRAVVRRLEAALGEVSESGTAQTVTLRTDEAALSVSMLPTGPDQVMLVVTDLSEREALSRRSQASQNRFEQAFRGNAAAMVIAHQTDLRIIDVNARWLEMFGATREQVIGKTSVELGLISVENAQDRIAKHKELSGGYDAELDLQTIAGARVTVLASAKPITFDGGRCTLTTLIDITARKHAEEAFAVAFRASPAGMMLVDVASDSVIAVNQRLLDMTGFCREDLVGRSIPALAFVMAPSRDELVAELGRKGRLDGVEIRIRTRDGTGVWTLASAELITLQEKPHRLTVFTDIRTRKLYERRLLIQQEIGHILAQALEIDAAVPRAWSRRCVRARTGTAAACGSPTSEESCERVVDGIATPASGYSR